MFIYCPDLLEKLAQKYLLIFADYYFFISFFESFFICFRKKALDEVKSVDEFLLISRFSFLLCQFQILRLITSHFVSTCKITKMFFQKYFSVKKNWIHLNDINRNVSTQTLANCYFAALSSCHFPFMREFYKSQCILEARMLVEEKFSQTCVQLPPSGPKNSGRC